MLIVEICDDHGAYKYVSANMKLKHELCGRKQPVKPGLPKF